MKKNILLAVAATFMVHATLNASGKDAKKSSTANQALNANIAKAAGMVTTAVNTINALTNKIGTSDVNSGDELIAALKALNTTTTAVLGNAKAAGLGLTAAQCPNMAALCTALQNLAAKMTSKTSTSILDKVSSTTAYLSSANLATVKAQAKILATTTLGSFGTLVSTAPITSFPGYNAAAVNALANWTK